MVHQCFYAFEQPLLSKVPNRESKLSARVLHLLKQGQPLLFCGERCSWFFSEKLVAAVGREKHQ